MLHIWKPLDESLIVSDNFLDLRLLEHHLRDPNPVGIIRPSPRHIALVILEPC